MIYFITLLLIAFLSYLLTWLMIRVSTRFGIYDFPSERKIHKSETPILGGLAIILAFFIGELFILGVTHASSSFPILMMLSYLPVFAISLYDDLREVNVYVRLTIQVLSCLIIAFVGPRIEYIPLPVGGRLYLGGFSIVITALWYLVIMNGFNFIDGLDGLAAGLAVIAAANIFVTKTIIGDSLSALLCVGIGAAALGFLRFNFHPARIFMGDTGANFLGFTLAAVSLLGQGRTVAFTSLLLPLGVLSLPIFDVIHRVARRTSERKALFLSDKDHIHHRLLEMGFGHVWVVVEFYLLTAIFGGAGLFLLTKSRLYVYIFAVLFLFFSVIWLKNKR